MGLAIRHTSQRMVPRLHAYHVRRQEQRLKGAERAGASWAYRTLKTGQGRAAQCQAEAWHARQIQERCDAWFDGLYD